MAITTADLLDTVKRNVTMPSNQVRFSDADLLKFADECTRSVILPRLSSIRQEFLVTSQSITVTADQSSYKIPYRAVGRTLRHLELMDSNGVFIRDLAFVAPEDRRYFTGQSGSGEPRGYAVQGDKIELLPAPASANYQLKMYYLLAPSRLVETTNASQITNINSGTITIDTAVTDFTSGALMDFIDGYSGSTSKAIDITNGSVSGTTLTFTAADLPDDLAVGDWVALAGYTPVVQLPDELAECLAHAIVCGVLNAQGDFEGLASSKKRLDEMLDAGMQLLTPRVESKQPVVIHYNGLLNTQRSRRTFRYYP